MHRDILRSLEILSAVRTIRNTRKRFSKLSGKNIPDSPIEYKKSSWIYVDLFNGHKKSYGYGVICN